MRYRPLGNTQMAVSAVSLALTDGPRRLDPFGWRDMIFSAMENGVNAFEIVGEDPALLEGLGQAIEVVDRHLVFVAYRVGANLGQNFTPEGLTHRVDALLVRSGIEYLDALLLHDPAEEILSNEALAALKALREAGSARMIGIAGESPAMDAYIASRQFDIFATSYNLLSGWSTRNRIREAVDRNMAIIGYSFCPPQIGGPPEPAGLLPKKLFWIGKPQAPPEAGAYEFLHHTNGWTAEEICLTYALTQPALATVQLTSDQVDRLPELAEAAEKELPPGIAPRIEMARFGGPQIQARA